MIVQLYPKPGQKANTIGVSSSDAKSPIIGFHGPLRLDTDDFLCQADECVNLGPMANTNVHNLGSVNFYLLGIKVFIRLCG